MTGSRLHILSIWNIFIAAGEVQLFTHACRIDLKVTRSDFFFFSIELRLQKNPPYCNRTVIEMMAVSTDVNV